MSQSRAKHFSCIIADPKDPTIAYAVAAGGYYIKTHVDLFLKKTTQTYHDSNQVELFNFKTEKWKIFSAQLCIARHQGTICNLNRYLYVIGGHRLEHPTEFINSIERCHI